MVKELKKRFIKTTMLVVTILLVVFLASIIIINYSLTKQDNTTVLNKIISRNLRAIPGLQTGNAGFVGQNNGSPLEIVGEVVVPGDGGPGAVNEGNGGPGAAGPGIEGPEVSGPEAMTEPEPASGQMETMTEPEPAAGPGEAMTEPSISGQPSQPMSESGPDSEERVIGEDLGRYAVARLNADGVIVFKDYSHDPTLDFAGLVDLINAANVEFAPVATGETETEEQFNSQISGVEGNPPVDEGSTPPADEGSTPPADEGSIPPAGEGSNPPSGEDSIPPANEGSAPPSGEDNAPGEGEGNTPAVNTDEDSAIQEGTTQPREERGTVNGYVYYAVQQADGSVLYAFLNISEQISSVVRIVLVTVTLGVVLWFLILLVVMLLSAKAIAPIAENIEKQRQFITDAGHELKTPLAVIVSNVDVQELHSGKTKWLDNIRAQALRLSELTKQMLTLSKMEESGSTAFVATTFDASKELNEMVHIFMESASLRDIQIQTDIEPGVQIHFSKEQYQRMTELLLDNAMKYGKEHGFLAVSLHSERKTITLRFKNNCDQLPNIDPDRLFERFYRSDSSRSRQTGGSGIGLAVVRAIAEHGGGYAKAHFLPDEVIEFEIQLQKKN